MFLGFFCSSASFTQMQPEHYVLTKLAAWKCSYNYGCHHNLSPFSFLPFSLHHAGVSSLLFLIFPAVISAWDNEEEEGNPPPITHAHTITQITPTRWITWGRDGIQSSVESLDDSGWGRLLSQYLIDILFAVSAHSVGGNKSTVPWQPH